MRTETDSLGSKEIPDDVLWGIHTARALENFPNTGLPKYPVFYSALASVKLAAAKANAELGYLDPQIADALIQALEEMKAGKWFEFFVTDPLQGGAGTSVNMNINEIAANRATEIMGGKRGEYKVDPLVHVNMHQSTNDVYPTAFKLAVLKYLNMLEPEINKLLESFQNKEREFANIIKSGRTELEPAVPTTLGKTFSAYSDLIARDRWRIFKSVERIRQINMGGTALGTGIAAPKKYIFKVSTILKSITGFPVSRAENLTDATQNHDQTAEVFAMLGIYASNLGKIASDLRLSAMLNEINIPPVQQGSSIMPGKYNPVIPELIINAAHKIIGNETSAKISILRGELELNAFAPVIFGTMLETLDILLKTTPIFREKCINGITANKNVCKQNLLSSPSTAAILIAESGYKNAEKAAQYMIRKNCNLKTAVLDLNLMTEEKLDKLLSPAALTALGH